MRFAGKRVLVTGASSGIGRATALAFAREGARVVLAARRATHLLELARELEATAGRGYPVACDLTQPDGAGLLVEAAQEKLGGLDILVNNAGIGLFGPLEAITESQLRHVFELNVFAVVRLTQLALPMLKASRGQLVNVSSVLGHRALPLVGGYAASKAALKALTQAWRAELFESGVDVLLVSPGLTRTGFREARLHAEGYARQAIPLQAMAPEAVARAILAACLCRKRETVLTLAGRAMVHADRLVPGLFERLVPLVRRAGGPKR